MMALLSATADINLKFVTPKIEGFWKIVFFFQENNFQQSTQKQSKH